MIRRANAPAARVRATTERASRQARRLQAAALFAQRVRPAEVARRLGVSKQAGVPGRGEGDPAVGWAGRPSHTAMAAFLATQRDWLVVERLPGYAPELNPAEQVPQWASLKGNQLANLAGEGLGGVIRAAWQGIGRIGRAWHLPYSFLRHAGLSVL
jgi:hypothetical protein